MFLLHFAAAAHNVAHFDDQCEFDENAFSDRMKVGLYNSKRNQETRAKATHTERTATVTAATGTAATDNEQPAAKRGTKAPASTNIPAPTDPGDETQARVEADLVAHCLEAATNGGTSFSCNIRLIRSAVFRRDPQGKNKPLQNALRALLNGVRRNDVNETKEALRILEEDENLGANM